MTIKILPFLASLQWTWLDSNLDDPLPSARIHAAGETGEGALPTELPGPYLLILLIPCPAIPPSRTLIS
jgi:hypothetical protein